MNSIINRVSPKIRSWIFSLNWVKDKVNHEASIKIRDTLLEYDRLYYAGLKCKFLNRPGFVIGNGPSLMIEDLERLKNSITIASNKIFLAFEYTNWRPSFYTIVDPIEWEKYGMELKNYVNEVHIPNYIPWNKSSCGTRRFKSLGLSGDGITKEHSNYNLDFSSDISIGAFGGCTVTMENLQLAVHLGLNPIYLIGCDHNYRSQPINAKRDQPIQIEDVNHFIKGYRQPGEITNPGLVEIMERSYHQARKFGDFAGVKIFNATRGGCLEVFERVNLDDVFEKYKI